MSRIFLSRGFGCGSPNQSAINSFAHPVPRLRPGGGRSRAQVNLGLSAIYLDEKRRFFLEGKDFFAFSMGDQIRPFYSRRIGLNAEGHCIDSGWGAIVGQVGE